MSKTFQFGNGEWAVGKETALAYNDENSNFKPLPFTFDRASTATVVNKQGLIETVGIDEPRIDFLNNTKGHLLLEPSRQNVVTYSEDFSNSAWTTNNATITSNQIISPDGALNADKITEDTSNTDHKTRDTIVFSNGTYTWSVLAKADERDFVAINVFDGTTLFGHTFNLFNGTLGSLVSGSSSVVANIEDYGSEWYRCSISFTASSGTGQANVGTALNSTTISYQGDGTSGLYIWGAQLEAGSYATSYIPTQGSAVTRSAESCEQTLPYGVIGQTEGTMYLEFKYLGIGSSVIPAVLNNGTNSNRIQIEINSAGSGFLYVVDGGTFQAAISLGSFVGNTNYKIGIAYKVNDFVAYKNGIQIGSDNSGNVPLLTQIQLGKELSTSYSGLSNKKTNLYNTRLSNSELATLTTL